MFQRFCAWVKFPTGAMSALCGALLLSGCTTASLHELRTAALVDDPFLRTLASQYLVFAEQEAADYDWGDSQRFAQKGLSAAYGTMPEPEAVSDWDIPSTIIPELQEARRMLALRLNNAVMQAQPAEAALALFSFDCWLEEQEENWQDVEIDRCREDFYNALNQLEPQPEQVEDIAALQEQAITLAKSAEEESYGGFSSFAYTISFESGAMALDAKGKQVVDAVVEDLKGLGSYEVILNGHTDRTGDADTNLDLALKRAGMVKQQLVEKGVNPRWINVFSFGESDPKEPTADNVPNAKNRRVEIFVTG